jgi:hypothetical protein
MNKVKVTSAAALDQMNLAQRQAHFEASIVLDLDQVPETFLQRVRSRLQDRVDSRRTAE